MDGFIKRTGWLLYLIIHRALFFKLILRRSATEAVLLCLLSTKRANAASEKLDHRARVRGEGVCRSSPPDYRDFFFFNGGLWWDSIVSVSIKAAQEVWVFRLRARKRGIERTEVAAHGSRVFQANSQWSFPPTPLPGLSQEQGQVGTLRVLLSLLRISRQGEELHVYVGDMFSFPKLF